MAEELGNPDLVFDAKILGAKVAYSEEKLDLATKILEDLLEIDPSEKEKADIYYELYKVSGQAEKYRQHALSLYQNLYSETPQFLFRKRMQQLILRK